MVREDVPRFHSSWFPGWCVTFRKLALVLDDLTKLLVVGRDLGFEEVDVGV